jgi:hypothetical protein
MSVHHLTQQDPDEEVNPLYDICVRRFQMPTGASSGLVLKSDFFGNGTWQSGGGGGITPSYVYARSTQSFSIAHGVQDFLVFDTIGVSSLDWSLAFAGHGVTTSVGGVYQFTVTCPMQTSQTADNNYAYLGAIANSIETGTGQPIGFFNTNSGVTFINETDQWQMGVITGLCELPPGSSFSPYIFSNIDNVISVYVGGGTVAYQLQMVKIAELPFGYTPKKKDVASFKEKIDKIIEEKKNLSTKKDDIKKEISPAKKELPKTELPKTEEKKRTGIVLRNVRVETVKDVPATLTTSSSPSKPPLIPIKKDDGKKELPTPRSSLASSVLIPRSDDVKR